MKDFSKARMKKSIGYAKAHAPKPFVPHVPFDMYQCDNVFQQIRAQADDKSYIDALDKRYSDLTPTQANISQLNSLVIKIQSVLDALAIEPGDFEACQLDEVKLVGAFKKATLLSKKLVADICVVLRTLPTREAVTQLANETMKQLRLNASGEDLIKITQLMVHMNEAGFQIRMNETLAIQVLITTQYQNIKRLDVSLHLDSKICQKNLAAIKHCKWFEDNVKHPSIIVLIRLLKDLKSRFEALQPLNPWLIDLIAQYVVMSNSKQEPLSTHLAFKRILRIISAGFFLPGSAGFIDPCEIGSHRVHTEMTLEQQDAVCYTCQTLLRVMSHGGYRQVLGLEGSTAIASTPSVWTSVVVTPSDKAYESKDDANREYMISN